MRIRDWSSDVCSSGLMPYKLAEIAAHYNVSYLPIISSARAFRALWKRSYHKVAELMSAVVYEDPWLEGGHNGLSNAEDPRRREDRRRVVAGKHGSVRGNLGGRGNIKNKKHTLH